ncbi:MAG: TrbG/VirB9 family P-type conjugative transfer protein [Cetobacterium sp.]
MNIVKIILSIILFSKIVFGDSEQFLKEISPSTNATIISGVKEAKANVQTEFVFNENSMYTIYCRVNYLTSIFLQPGEVVNYVGGGDTARWSKASAMTGSEDGERTVIYVKPFSLGLKTNLVINTNKRTYNVNLYSAKEWYNPVVKWLYPQDDIMKNIVKSNREEEMTLTDPRNLNYKYSVNTKKYSFVPSIIFDDGKKTFLIMKQDLQELPSFYIKEDKKLLLVNYRVKGNYLIIDRTFDTGVLRLGNKEITIKRRG